MKKQSLVKMQIGITLSFLSQTALAAPTNLKEPKVYLRAWELCDRALQVKQDALISCGDTIHSQTALIEQNTAEINRLNEEASKLSKNPWVYFGLGALSVFLVQTLK